MSQELQVFEDLTDEETQVIFTLFPVLPVSPGEDVVTQGSTDSAVYVVLRGKFDVRIAGDGNERVLTTLEEGAVFGELSFLDDLPRSATVRAGTAGEILRLDRAGFDRLMATKPSAASKIYRDLAKVVTRRLRDANDKLIRIPEHTDDARRDG